MIELRTSERSLFKRCPQRWHWAVVEGLAPRREATPLWFGTLIHYALAEWYLPGFRRGPHPAATFEKAIEGNRIVKIPSMDEDDEKVFIDAKALGIEMLNNYIKHYGRDDHKNYIITEKTGHIYLPPWRQKKGRGVKYYYTFDGVYQDMRDGRYWLDEHKTAASISTSHLPLDDQGGSYYAVASGQLMRMGLLKPGEQIEGIMFNFLRKAAADTRPKNADGMSTNKPNKKHYEQAFIKAGVPKEFWHRRLFHDMQELAKDEGMRVLGDVSAVQNADLFLREPIYRSPEERRTQLVRIQKDAWHIDRARNDPGYPIIKNVVAGGMQACSGCPFFQMCQLDEQGDQESVEEYKAAMYLHRDPYQAYRKSA